MPNFVNPFIFIINAVKITQYINPDDYETGDTEDTEDTDEDDEDTSDDTDENNYILLEAQVCKCNLLDLVGFPFLVFALFCFLLFDFICWNLCL